MLHEDPLVFRVGTATILGSFKLTSDTLLVELAYIEGGGEGALPSLASLVRRYGKRKGLLYIRVAGARDPLRQAELQASAGGTGPREVDPVKGRAPEDHRPLW